MSFALVCNMAQARVNFKCFRCMHVVAGNYSNLTKHLRHVHAMKTSSTSKAHLVCAQNGCSEVFTNFSDYNYHLKVCTLFDASSQQGNPSSLCRFRVAPSLIAPDCSDVGLSDCLALDVSTSLPSISTTIVVEAKDFLAKVMLDLKAKHNVSNAALDFLTDRLREGFNGLTTQNDEEDDVESGPPQKRMRHDSNFTVLSQLNSQKKRNTYFVNNFNLIEPEEFLVNLSFGTGMINGMVRCRNIENTFQYMSLKKRLSVICE